MTPKKIVWVLRWFHDGEPAEGVPYPYFQGGPDGCNGPSGGSFAEKKARAVEFGSISEAKRVAGAWAYRRHQFSYYPSGWKVVRRTKRTS